MDIGFDGLVDVCVSWPPAVGTDPPTYIFQPDSNNIHVELTDLDGNILDPQCIYPAAYDIDNAQLLLPLDPAGNPVNEFCVTIDLRERFPQLPPEGALAGKTITSIGYESFITDPWVDPGTGECLSELAGITRSGFDCKKLWVGRIEVLNEPLPPSPFKFAWDGFFSPIENDTTNQVKAGRAIPIKFSLGGYQGLDIFAMAPLSVQFETVVGEAINPIPDSELPANPAGGAGLSYDTETGVYTYVWKTKKDWANQNRQLKITLRDGTEHTAEFTFTKK